ncbi:MAG: NHL repeat-containing protein [Chloroflexota bacterium]|nr:NHL repeat-containing protein [Chloroflexota bacterium]
MAVATASSVRYSHSIGQLAQSGPGFNNPVDVAVAEGGRLYVLNRSNMAHAEMNILRVTICTIDEEYIGQFTTFGSGDGQLIWPTSIATDRLGHVYVSDERRHDVQMFDRDGNFLRKWGGLGSGDGQFNRPSGLAVDGDGNVLVVDALNNRIQRWSPAGEFLTAWGAAGSGPGQFNLPWGIAVDRQGQIYVADWRNSRVQKFGPDGRYLASFGGSGTGEGSLDRPAGVGVDSVGNVYVSDYGRDRVQVYAPDGSPLVTLLGDATMTTWARPFVEADPEMSKLREEHAEDVAAQERVFEGPMGIEVDERDRIVIADCCKHRVQVYERV